MSCLFHYCSNEKCFGILNSKTLRLSDIQKSNDYRELSLFFPALIYKVEDLYRDNPFPFKYNNMKNEEAFSDMARQSYDYWRKRFLSGDFSNFVVCFSEFPDSLSQWRGYADNGKGCCIGFSKEAISNYCEKHNEVLRLERVEYLSEREINNRIKEAANECIEAMKEMREWIVDNMTHDDNDPDTDGLLHYNFDGFIEAVFVDTLRFKSEAFSEENEWRIFLKKPAYKNPEWICGTNKEEMHGPRGFSDTIRYLKNKVRFQITEDDLIPFCPIDFSEFSWNPVKEIWRGPKNMIRESDLQLYLKQNGYVTTTIKHSKISYC